MSTKSSISLVAILLLIGSLPVFPQSKPPTRSRAEFAKAMGRITENMPQNEVVAILGQPDDIRTESDPGGIRYVHGKEVWCYGTKGHLSFPTLGCIYIDTNGMTQEVFGGKGKPPRSGLFKGDELQDLLRLLHTAPRLEGYQYDPLPVIRIINALQPLGREKALDVLGEYVRVSEETFHSGLSLVLRVLFDLPDNVDSRRGWIIGMPSPSGPKDFHRIPRFPIVLADDIPLMLVSGYTVASYLSQKGDPTPLEKDLEFFTRHGKFRSQPLIPTDDPLGALTNLIASQQWIYGNTNLTETDWFSFGEKDTEQREKSMLMEQLLRLIDSVYRLPTDVYGNRLPCGISPEPSWQKIVADVAALKIRWDSKAQIYMFPDGSYIPKLTRKIYQREIWRLTGMGYEDAELILERKSDDWVNVTVELTQKTGAVLKPATLAIYAGGEIRSPLVTFNFAAAVGEGGGSTQGRTIALNDGVEIKAALSIDGFPTNFSSILKP